MRLGVLHNLKTGTVLGHSIARADTSFTRVVGLLGRSVLGAGEGIWIIPSSGVHTFAMQFPIDVIGLDSRMRVLRLWPRLRPWRVPLPSLSVRSVVELAEGEIDRLGTVVGDQLAWHVSDTPANQDQRHHP